MLQPVNGISPNSDKKPSRLWAIPLAAILGCSLALPARADDAPVRKFEIAIHNGGIEREYTRIRVTEGDHVVLRWSTDGSETVVHLEGYEIAITIEADQPGVIEFNALITGRFPIHKHATSDHGSTTKGGGRHGALSYLEVHPK